MRRHQYQEYRGLQDRGWNVDKTDALRRNSGSESPEHIHAKCAVFHVATEHGWKCTCECDGPSGEIDCLLWGHPDMMTVAVELERDIQPEVMDDKLNRYVRKEPIQELYTIPVDDLPEQIGPLHERIRGELGL